MNMAPVCPSSPVFICLSWRLNRFSFQMRRCSSVARHMLCPLIQDPTSLRREARSIASMRCDKEIVGISLYYEGGTPPDVADYQRILPELSSKTNSSKDCRRHR